MELSVIPDQCSEMYYVVQDLNWTEINILRNADRMSDFGKKWKVHGKEHGKMYARKKHSHRESNNENRKMLFQLWSRKLERKLGKHCDVIGFMHCNLTHWKYFKFVSKWHLLYYIERPCKKEVQGWFKVQVHSKFNQWKDCLLFRCVIIYIFIV